MLPPRLLRYRTLEVVHPRTCFGSELLTIPPTYLLTQFQQLKKQQYFSNCARPSKFTYAQRESLGLSSDRRLFFILRIYLNTTILDLFILDLITLDLPFLMIGSRDLDFSNLAILDLQLLLVLPGTLMRRGFIKG